MEKVISLKICETFMIKGRGLILIPSLKFPRVSGFKPFTKDILVVKPDGENKKYSAKFLLEHFHFVEGFVQWKIIFLLPDARIDDIPEGSEIVITENIYSRLDSKI